MPSLFSCVRLIVTLWTGALQALYPWDSPGKNTGMKKKKREKNTGVDCHALLQGPSPPRDQTCVSYVSCIGRWVLYH